MCATCPWDRFCITPPSMTSEEVKAAIDKADADDRRRAEEAEAKGEKAGMPVGMLFTAVAMGGRDMQATLCPVLALRLRSSDGERIVRSTKDLMRAWTEHHMSSK